MVASGIVVEIAPVGAVPLVQPVRHVFRSMGMHNIKQYSNAQLMGTVHQQLQVVRGTEPAESSGFFVEIPLVVGSKTRGSLWIGFNLWILKKKKLGETYFFYFSVSFPKKFHLKNCKCIFLYREGFELKIRRKSGKRNKNSRMTEWLNGVIWQVE